MTIVEAFAGFVPGKKECNMASMALQVNYVTRSVGKMGRNIKTRTHKHTAYIGTDGRWFVLGWVNTLKDRPSKISSSQ